MNDLQIKQLEILNETVAHFNLKNLSILKDQYGNPKNCLYAPTEGVSGGCAVGRLIEDKEFCKKLDTEFSNKPVSTIAEFLPDEVTKFGVRFLIKLQELHDVPSNWNENGLTERGQAEYEIIKNYIQNHSVVA